LELPIQQVTGHLDQPNDDIGADRGVGVFNAVPETRVIGAGLPVEAAEAACVRMVRRPFGEATVLEEIAVIGEEFF
jgi:hypothetical protein